MVQQIKDEVLTSALADRVRARVLSPDGTYTRITPPEGELPPDSQTLIARSRTRKLHPTHFVPREVP